MTKNDKGFVGSATSKISKHREYFEENIKMLELFQNYYSSFGTSMKFVLKDQIKSIQATKLGMKKLKGNEHLKNGYMEHLDQAETTVKSILGLLEEYPSIVEVNTEDEQTNFLITHYNRLVSEMVKASCGPTTKISEIIKDSNNFIKKFAKEELTDVEYEIILNKIGEGMFCYINDYGLEFISDVMKAAIDEINKVFNRKHATIVNKMVDMAVNNFIIYGNSYHHDKLHCTIIEKSNTESFYSRTIPKDKSIDKNNFVYTKLNIEALRGYSNQLNQKLIDFKIHIKMSKPADPSVPAIKAYMENVENKLEEYITAKGVEYLSHKIKNIINANNKNSKERDTRVLRKKENKMRHQFLRIYNELECTTTYINKGENLEEAKTSSNDNTSKSNMVLRPQPLSVISGSSSPNSQKNNSDPEQLDKEIMKPGENSALNPELSNDRKEVSNKNGKKQRNNVYNFKEYHLNKNLNSDEVLASEEMNESKEKISNVQKNLDDVCAIEGNPNQEVDGKSTEENIRTEILSTEKSSEKIELKKEIFEKEQLPTSDNTLSRDSGSKIKSIEEKETVEPEIDDSPEKETTIRERKCCFKPRIKSEIRTDLDQNNNEELFEGLPIFDKSEYNLVIKEGNTYRIARKRKDPQGNDFEKEIVIGEDCKVLKLFPDVGICRVVFLRLKKIRTIPVSYLESLQSLEVLKNLLSAKNSQIDSKIMSEENMD